MPKLSVKSLFLQESARFSKDKDFLVYKNGMCFFACEEGYMVMAKEE
jgi:hypothetical protein